MRAIFGDKSNQKHGESNVWEYHDRGNNKQLLTSVRNKSKRSTVKVEHRQQTAVSGLCTISGIGVLDPKS